MIKFHFHKNNSLLSKLIQKLTQGKFSHVSIQINDLIYESKEFKGVIVSTYDQWKNSIVIDNIDTIEIDCDSKVFEYFLRNKIGSRYDYRGIFSFLTLQRKQNEKNYYCSELAGEFFKLYFNQECEYLISPNRLYDRLNFFKLGLLTKSI